MAERRSQHIYRLRWMRPKWTHPRVKLFTRWGAAEAYEEKIRASWADPEHAVAWTTIDVMHGEWQEATGPATRRKRA